jgi:polysaccharide export outer membrane protein
MNGGKALLRNMSVAVAAWFIVASAPAIAQQDVTPGFDSAHSSNSNDKSASEYVIGPGDALDIFVWRNQDLTTRVPVRPDGRISTPLVEDMIAVGKTPTQLARDIENVLGQYIRTPKVNVIVTSAASANSQVRVVGQAVTPRALPYRDGLTVMDVVIAVGGLSEYAAGNRAKIVRENANAKPTELKVRLKDLLDKGDMRQNLRMQPGDVLVIPESRF